MEEAVPAQEALDSSVLVGQDVFHLQGGWTNARGTSQRYRTRGKGGIDVADEGTNLALRGVLGHCTGSGNGLWESVGSVFDIHSFAGGVVGKLD